MSENTKTELGAIKIHKSVIGSIAIEATKEIPGVAKIGGDLKTYLMEFFGKKDTAAIKIEFDKDGEVIITIPVVVKYDHNIPEIASKIQENVKTAIENSTSIIVKDINVTIQEIIKSEA
jgi:uncharacterized alkaline shock family protein YloU